MLNECDVDYRIECIWIQWMSFKVWKETNYEKCLSSSYKGNIYCAITNCFIKCQIMYFCLANQHKTIWHYIIQWPHSMWKQWFEIQIPHGCISCGVCKLNTLRIYNFHPLFTFAWARFRAMLSRTYQFSFESVISVQLQNYLTSNMHQHFLISSKSNSSWVLAK